MPKTLAQRIRAFRKECVDAEHTDTDTAWQLLNQAEHEARQTATVRKYLRDALDTIDAVGSIDMTAARKALAAK
jgi:hypothetical protein